MVERAKNYEWGLQIDPSTATADDMQAVMTIVKRLVNGLEFDGDGFGIGADEFDGQPFGEIPRLARLHDLLDRLRTNGVNVIAGTYTRSRLRSLKAGEIPGFGEIGVRRPGQATKYVFETERVFKIRFVSSDVEEEVVPIYTGPSLENFERLGMDDEIPF